MNLAVPDAEPGTDREQTSHEQALTYPSDIIMTSARPGTLTPDDLAAHAAWGVHAAAQAGQAYPWNQDSIDSYQGMAEAIEHLVDVFTNSEKVI